MKSPLFNKNMNLYLGAAFLNAFVDLGHKITIQNVIFKTMDGATLLAMTQIVNAMILLPFVLFFIPAGEINDQKSRLANMRFLALIATGLCVLISLFYALGLFWFAFAATLALGTQAAFYSPAKYAFAKDLAKESGLAKTNSALQATSIVSIILSTLFFSVMFELLTTDISGDKEEYLRSLFPIGVALTLLSATEYLLLKRVSAEQKQPLTNSESILAKYKKIVFDKSVFAAMALLSIFFALSQSVMASFPSFAKESLKITSALAVQAAMALSAVGVIVGSTIAGRYKNSRHRVALVFFGMLGYFFMLPAVTNAYVYAPFFCIGVAAGFIIVPLNTLIQERVESHMLGSAISLSNLMQNVTMLAALALGTWGAVSGVEAKQIILSCALLALLAGLFSLFYFPQPVLEGVIAALFAFKYRLNVSGATPPPGTKILIGNHVSYIDWAFLQIALDEKIHFLIEKEIYEKPLLKPFLSFFGALPIDKNHAKEPLKAAISLLRDGKTVVIFPEGELTKDGTLGSFKKGFEMLSQKSGAEIYPFYIDGLFGSRFSKAPSKSYRVREVRLFFGGKLKESGAEAARAAVFALKP